MNEQIKECEYSALLDAYADGELPQDTAEQVEAHLDACPACQAYLDDILAIRAAFPTLDDTEVPEGFADRVLDRLPARVTVLRPKRRNLWKRTALPVAASLALLLALRTVWLTDDVGGGEVMTRSMPVAEETAQAAEDSPSEAAQTARLDDHTDTEAVAETAESAAAVDPDAGTDGASELDDAVDTDAGADTDTAESTASDADAATADAAHTDAGTPEAAGNGDAENADRGTGGAASADMRTGTPSRGTGGQESQSASRNGQTGGTTRPSGSNKASGTTGTNGNTGTSGGTGTTGGNTGAAGTASGKTTPTEPTGGGAAETAVTTESGGTADRNVTPAVPPAPEPAVPPAPEPAVPAVPEPAVPAVPNQALPDTPASPETPAVPEVSGPSAPGTGETEDPNEGFIPREWESGGSSPVSGYEDLDGEASLMGIADPAEGEEPADGVESADGEASEPADERDETARARNIGEEAEAGVTLPPEAAPCLGRFLPAERTPDGVWYTLNGSELRTLADRLEDAGLSEEADQTRTAAADAGYGETVLVFLEAAA